MAVWRRLASERLGDFKIFTVRRDRIVSPRTEEEHDFYVRDGTGEVTLEIPGGAIDRGDADPLAAARRELREETGYEASEWVNLGFVHPNPAIQSNRCYTFLAR